MAPYSVKIACTQRTKAQVICACLKEKVYFNILWRQHGHTKQNWQWNLLAFPLVEFHKIWKTGSKYDFTIVGAHLLGKSIRPVFSQW